MGTSYVEYSGFGFWTRDKYLASWIQSILDELGSQPSLDPWHKLLIERWNIQVEIDGGCMSLGLDELVAQDERRVELLGIAQRVLPASPEAGRRTGELFIALLKHELTTTVKSPIDYF